MGGGGGGGCGLESSRVLMVGDVLGIPESALESARRVLEGFKEGERAVGRRADGQDGVGGERLGGEEKG